MEDDNDPFDPLPPGARVGNYEIVGLIGQGGMGAVYEAFHVALRKAVALKVLLGHAARDRVIVQRFMQEGVAASRVGHEGIVDVSDVGTHEGTPYLVMELLQGESLADAVRREGRLSPQFVADVMVPVCSALAAAHAVGVIHRDLKPDNIFLTRTRRGAIVPKLVDFGVSKVTSNQIEDMSLTRTGVLVGTPHYMSPEQAVGRMDLDERTDQYAAGVILYECLSGDVPFDGENYLSVIHSVATEEPPPLRAKVPGLPPALNAVVLRALARNRDERFPSIAALGLALLPFASPAVRAAWESDLVAAAEAATPAGRQQDTDVDAHDTPLTIDTPHLPTIAESTFTRVGSLGGLAQGGAARVKSSLGGRAQPSVSVEVLDEGALVDEQPTEAVPLRGEREAGSEDVDEDDDRRTPILPSVRKSAAPADPEELERRVEEILGLYSSGVRPLPKLDAAALECLIAAGIVDPEGRAPDGPTAGEVLEFLLRWPQVTAHGYLSSRRRDDRYATVEGVECDLSGVAIERVARLRAEFRAFAGHAPEFRDANMLLYASWA